MLFTHIKLVSLPVVLSEKYMPFLIMIFAGDVVLQGI